MFSLGVITCNCSGVSGVILLRIQLRPVTSKSISFKQLEKTILTSKNARSAPSCEHCFDCCLRTFRCHQDCQSNSQTMVSPDTAFEIPCPRPRRSRSPPTAPPDHASASTLHFASRSAREERLPSPPLSP